MVVNGLLNLAKCGQKPVSDYGASAFTVTILNVRPVFAAISTKTIDELQTLNLTDWTEVLGFVGDGTPVTLHDPNAGINPQGFYRVLLAP